MDDIVVKGIASCQSTKGPGVIAAIHVAGVASASIAELIFGFRCNVIAGGVCIAIDRVVIGIAFINIKANRLGAVPCRL